MLPQFGGLPGQSFEQEYEQRIRALITGTRQLVALITELSEDSSVNDYAASIAATADGANVGNSTLNKETAISLNAVFESFIVWLNTPLASAGNEKPITLIRQRW